MKSEAHRRKFSIAILTNYPFDGTSFTGGVETATAGLLEGLSAYTGEFDFHIVALSGEIRSHITECRRGMTYHFLAIPAAWYARPHLLPNMFNARAVLKKLQPDLVHCQDNMALAIGAISVQPLRKVFTVHGIKSVESRIWQGPEYWSHQMDAVLERWVRTQFDEVITISPYVDQFLPAHVTKHHVANPVRTLFFDRPQSGTESQHILFVGALTRLKRPLDVIRAFCIVKRSFADARLTIVGPDEDRKYVRELKQFIAEHRVAGIEFLGPRPQTEVAALMRRATVLALSSVQENTPMVVAEAMASGLPVIASRVGGVPMMMTENRDGLLFTCGDVEQLARLIGVVFRDPDLRARLSCNGRKKAHSLFSADVVAAATVNVYRTMMRT